MTAVHQHPPEEKCLPACPAWAEGVLELYALQRRYAEMLEACRAAQAIECVIVAPAAPGVELPEYLHDEELVWHPVGATEPFVLDLVRFFEEVAPEDELG